MSDQDELQRLRDHTAALERLVESLHRQVEALLRQLPYAETLPYAD